MTSCVSIRNLHRNRDPWASRSSENLQNIVYCPLSIRVPCTDPEDPNFHVRIHLRKLKNQKRLACSWKSQRWYLLLPILPRLSSEANLKHNIFQFVFDVINFTIIIIISYETCYVIDSVYENGNGIISWFDCIFRYEYV